MNKYYVTIGEKQILVLGTNDFHAAIVAFQKVMTANYMDTIPLCIVVSEKGFDNHLDDTFYPTAQIVETLRLSNEYEKDW